MSGYGGVVDSAIGRAARRYLLVRARSACMRAGQPCARRVTKRLARLRRSVSPRGPGCGRLPYGQLVDLPSEACLGGGKERRPPEDGQRAGDTAQPARDQHRDSGPIRSRCTVGGMTYEGLAQPRGPRGPHEETERSSPAPRRCQDAMSHGFVAVRVVAEHEL
jgi:hypothetical protein